jgi:hypothetical protein
MRRYKRFGALGLLGDPLRLVLPLAAITEATGRGQVYRKGNHSNRIRCNRARHDAAHPSPDPDP